MIFKHTAREPKLWRGWLENGQSLEISWGGSGWKFGGGVHIYSDDNDLGNRLLSVALWKARIFIPLGIVPHPWPALAGPQWSVYGSSKFGFTVCWGLRRKSWNWPWDLHTLRYEHQLLDGSWRDVFDRKSAPATEEYTYTYTLRSGAVQHRTAKISKRRHILTWTAFKRVGWPKWAKESIDVEFSGEVGERSGSWKGGTTRCSHDLRAGETMLQSLRRMEVERKFN